MRLIEAFRRVPLASRIFWGVWLAVVALVVGKYLAVGQTPDLGFYLFSLLVLVDFTVRLRKAAQAPESSSGAGLDSNAPVSPPG